MMLAGGICRMGGVGGTVDYPSYFFHIRGRFSEWKIGGGWGASTDMSGSRRICVGDQVPSHVRVISLGAGWNRVRTGGPGGHSTKGR